MAVRYVVFRVVGVYLAREVVNIGVELGFEILDSKFVPVDGTISEYHVSFKLSGKLISANRIWSPASRRGKDINDVVVFNYESREQVIKELVFYSLANASSIIEKG